ncbi:hypothetical protein HDV00_002772, partial [Rhizophlyctis rosea]
GRTRTPTGSPSSSTPTSRRTSKIETEAFPPPRASSSSSVPQPTRQPHHHSPSPSQQPLRVGLVPDPNQQPQIMMMSHPPYGSIPIPMAPATAQQHVGLHTPMLHSHLTHPSSTGKDQRGVHYGGNAGTTSTISHTRRGSSSHPPSTVVSSTVSFPPPTTPLFVPAAGGTKHPAHHGAYPGVSVGVHPAADLQSQAAYMLHAQSMYYHPHGYLGGVGGLAQQQMAVQQQQQQQQQQQRGVDGGKGQGHRREGSRSSVGAVGGTGFSAQGQGQGQQQQQQQQQQHMPPPMVPERASGGGGYFERDGYRSGSAGPSSSGSPLVRGFSAVRNSPGLPNPQPQGEGFALQGQPPREGRRTPTERIVGEIQQQHRRSHSPHVEGFEGGRPGSRGASPPPPKRAPGVRGRGWGAWGGGGLGRGGGGEGR